MDDNYIGNGLNNANVFQIDRYFWTHAMHTIVHIQNKVMLKKNNDKTPHELWKGSADNNLYIKRNAKEVHNRRFQTSYHSYENQLQVEQR
jgi:hypothetical protein